MTLHIQEEIVDEDRNCIIYQGEPFEPCYSDNLGKLFRDLQKEHGRCTGHCYVDKRDGRTLAIGWVFSKRAQYDDVKKFFTRCTWITLLDECEHGDADELIRTRRGGKERIQTGFKYHVLKSR